MLYSKVINQHLYFRNRKIDTIKDIFINKDSYVITGILGQKQFYEFKNVFIKNNKFFINNKKNIKQGISIYNFNVTSKENKILGKVYNAEINFNYGIFVSIFSKRKIFFFEFSRRIFSTNEIEMIKNKNIIIKNDEIIKNNNYEFSY